MVKTPPVHDGELRKRRSSERRFLHEELGSHSGGVRGRAIARCFFVFRFLRTPAAETSTPDRGNGAAVAKGAREGPIADFLRNYRPHKSGQIKTWADQYDFELLERQMLIAAARTFKAEGIEEILWREALDDEDAGKFAEAAKKVEE